MPSLPVIAPSCGILLGRNEKGQFEHIGTAWCVGDSEWVTAWSAEDAPQDVQLLGTNSGVAVPISEWEHDGGIAGFKADMPGGVPVLPVRRGQELRKRDSLWSLGYPSMIDHPAFRLHRGSLTAELYFPYLCPWVISGHLALYTPEDGYLTGRCYSGMAGGPVLDQEGNVVGVLLGGEPAPEHPALSRFHRLV